MVMALTCVAALAGVTRAQNIYAVTDTSTLIRFNPATPGTVITVGTVSGITTGTLQSIDFRPATGALYGVSYDPTSNAAQLYTINLNNAVATAVGAPVTLTGTSGATRVSVDFNPVVDLLRVVTSGTANTTNYRINPTTGALVAQDTNLAFATGDPNAGQTPTVSAIAYSNNTPGASATTLYGYNFNNDALVRIGSVGGSPVSPNTGQVFTVGSSGQAATTETIGLDITGTNTAFLSASVGGFNDSLFTVDLNTGAATLVGQIGSGVDVLDIAVTAAAVPEPASFALGGIGALGATYVVRQRWLKHKARRARKREKK